MAKRKNQVKTTLFGLTQHSFKYKRIKRQGKYYNTIFRDGKFFQFDRWDKQHRKKGAIERGKSKRRIMLGDKLEKPTGEKTDIELLEEMQFKADELESKQRAYDMLREKARKGVSVNWKDMEMPEKAFNEIVDNIVVDGEKMRGRNTRKRRLAIQKMLNIKFSEEGVLDVSMFKKEGKQQMRYRDNKGRFAER